MLPTEVTFIGFSVDWDERKVIPACVVMAIRKAFPEPNNQYEGYHEIF